MGQRFNPRPCARGDGGKTHPLAVMERFQSTPLREGRLVGRGVATAHNWFQSTPLREGRLSWCSA